MRSKLNPTRIDVDVPEWTDATFQKARRAKDAIPGLFSAKVAEKLLRPRGRPKLERTKQLVSLRLSPDVLQYFRNRGPGWQTRIDETLRKSVGL
jgi:uncharacterized protein (DUF4415 family)